MGNDTTLTSSVGDRRPFTPAPSEKATFARRHTQPEWAAIMKINGAIVYCLPIRLACKMVGRDKPRAERAGSAWTARVLVLPGIAMFLPGFLLSSLNC